MLTVNYPNYASDALLCKRSTVPHGLVSDLELCLCAFDHVGLTTSFQLRPNFGRYVFEHDR